MKRSGISDADFQGVIAVPPLPRRDSLNRPVDFAEATRLLNHIAQGGMTRFMFGGNAFFYHLTLREYEDALDWMTALPDAWWALPSAGPTFGRLMDQAALLRSRRFPAVMLLPCSDPRDAAGLELGIREFSDATETPVILYLKSEDTFGANREEGLDAIGRLFGDRICVGIKYAVVRPEPGEDPYLKDLLQRVDLARVASGIGERPAVCHLRQWKLAGFTTGSGCVAPHLSQRIFELCQSAAWEEAERVRQRFLPLEDCRDAWNPAKVLHHAVSIAGIARTGPMPPFLSSLDSGKLARIRTALQPLLEDP